MLKNKKISLKRCYKKNWTTLEKKRCSLNTIVFQVIGKGLEKQVPKISNNRSKTGVSVQKLNKVAKVLCEEPGNAALFSKMKKLIKGRNDLYNTQKKVDWAMAELLAYGTLLIEGHGVRVSGQDAQRGTFSHRHAVIKDVKTEALVVPLNGIQKDQSQLSIYNSHLSEYCCVRF